MKHSVSGFNSLYSKYGMKAEECTNTCPVNIIEANPCAIAAEIL